MKGLGSIILFLPKVAKSQVASSTHALLILAR